MKHGTPFRAATMMAMALASIAQMFAPGTSGFTAAIAGMKYEGRGKGRARYHDGGGTAAAKRAAVKARNVKRHRAHCKGK